ncbi:ROK family transcriptional regulator [Dickeya zeae]|uniref:ROK family transcriptional regulator n=1 Tax=Dickeya zeae TaxID=204042 RepID=UPI0003A8C4AE|nr:ROK family transcriptional regulator [Dickeya zeae]
MIEIENDVPVLRQISVRAVMEYLLHAGPASRAAMAKATRLSKQTMSEVILILEERGWVRPCGLESGKVGRAAMNYEIADDLAYVLGMDVGATSIRLSLVNLRGNEIAHYEEENDNSGGINLVNRLCQLKKDLLAQQQIDERKLHSVSVAIPGVINQKTGTLDMAPNLKNMSGFALRDSMQQAFGCEVLIENDINAAAIGEYWRGCGQDDHSLAFISLGTGIGLGLILEGILLRGAMGAAGEISYLPLGGDAYTSESLRQGTLESVLGAAGISKRYHFAGGCANTPVREILSRYADKEPAAIVTIEETARTAALLVLSVSLMFDPESIIIGGNIGIRPELTERIRFYLNNCSPHPIQLKSSTLGSQSVLTGAVAISLNKLHNSLFGLPELSRQISLPKHL